MYREKGPFTQSSSGAEHFPAQVGKIVNEQTPYTVVKPSGRVATVKAVDLYYEADGTHYLLHFPYGLDIPVRSNCREAM